MISREEAEIVSCEGRIEEYRDRIANRYKWAKTALDQEDDEGVMLLLGEINDLRGRIKLCRSRIIALRRIIEDQD